MNYVVATERLGWPSTPRGLARILPGEAQTHLRYEDEPARPTATCHLQPAQTEPALCGYLWEILVPVPGAPAWTDLHPDLRGDMCEEDAGYGREDPRGRSYRYTYD